MIKIYNSLTRKKEEFTPINSPYVTMYACGLTPQNHAHLGHAVAALRFSIIRRYLTYKKFIVTYVENVTDIDDKIISRSHELNTTPTELANRYLNEYRSALNYLDVPEPNFNPKVTEFIPQIIKYISRLIEKGYAYPTPEGDVYYDVSKKEDYGKLSGRITNELQSGGRVQIETNKRSPHDFALWKKEDSNDLAWKSPWGKGRPGWHIECSVMSNSILGDTIDIHCGGLDLIFPHHENEIAQCEAHNNVKFTNYWVHCGLLEINGDKMSKSLFNFVTISEAIKTYGKELINFVILRHHYRSTIDFNNKIFQDNLNSLSNFYWSIPNDLWKDLNLEYIHCELSDKLVTDFEAAMENDFNTPVALTILSDYLNKSKELILENKTVEGNHLQKTILKLGRVLGLFSINYTRERLFEECLIFHQSSYGNSNILTLANLNELIQQRDSAKVNKDFKQADIIRDKIKASGITPMDGNYFQSWNF